MKTMRVVLFTIPLMLVGLLTAGCAVPPPAVDLTPVEAELRRLDSNQKELSGQMERLQDNLTLFEARLLDQQKVVETLRQGTSAQKVTPTGEKTSTIPPASIAAGPTESGNKPGSPTEIYLQAFADYASGRFDQAIAGFGAFLKYYPNSDYAGNAQYWLGECYYSRQEYGLAVAAFRKTVESYPQGGKAPDALLKMATALRQMNEVSQAEEALRLLRSRYPDTPAARKSLKTN
jgi:tol-pal system protein YbgF